MAYLDIETDDENDIFEATVDGDFDLKDREVDIAADIILMPPAGLKYAPTVYGDAWSFLNANVTSSAVIERKFKIALRAAGFEKPLIDLSNFPSEIGINNDQILISSS